MPHQRRERALRARRERAQRERLQRLGRLLPLRLPLREIASDDELVEPQRPAALGVREVPSRAGCASRPTPRAKRAGARRPRPRRASRRARAPPERTSASNSNPYRCNRTPDTGFQRAPPMRTPSLSQRGAETRGDAIAATAPSRSTRGPSIPNAPPVLSRRFGHCGVTDPEDDPSRGQREEQLLLGGGWREARGSFEKVTPLCPVGARRAFLRFRTSASAPRLSRRPPGRHNASVGAPSSCSLDPDRRPGPARARARATARTCRRRRSRAFRSDKRSARASVPPRPRDASLAESTSVVANVSRASRRARRLA